MADSIPLVRQSVRHRIGTVSAITPESCPSWTGARTNRARVRRDVLEREIVNPIKDELLDPDRIKRMAAQLQKQFNERVAAAAQRDMDAPRELAELDARLDRLRKRLRNGDPDMTDDEVQAAIDRAQTKRQQLAATSRPASSAAKVLMMLPKAAELYRKQVIDGLDGHPEATSRTDYPSRILAAGVWRK